MGILDSLAARLGYTKAILIIQPEPEPDYDVAITHHDRNGDQLPILSGVMTARGYRHLIAEWVVHHIEMGRAEAITIKIDGSINYMGILICNIDALAGVPIEGEA